MMPTNFTTGKYINTDTAENPGRDSPRGGLNPSELAGPREVSWKLHHDQSFPFGDFDTRPQHQLGSDPTCDPETRGPDTVSCNFKDKKETMSSAGVLSAVSKQNRKGHCS